MSEREGDRSLTLSHIRSLMVIAFFSGVSLLLNVNPATAGLLLLLAVLLVASREPLVVATLACVLATLSYNFFFFPPTRTFTVDEPENWVALATFLVASLVANRLLVRERRQAEAARRSREEIEALYEMSFALLEGGEGIEVIGSAARRYLERIGATSGGLVRFGASAQQQQILAWMGEPAGDDVEDLAAGVARHGRTTEVPSRFGRDLAIPLLVAGRAAAALIVRGPHARSSGLSSAANLLVLAIERERFLHERARIDALRETDELKTSLLQAVSHDLRSPLTVLTVESEALERMLSDSPNTSSHVRTIRDEVARLHRRVSNLLAAARLEAGIASPRPEPTPPADLFRAARENLRTIVDSRPIRTTVGADTPDVFADPSLALEIIVNLIENAHHAAPPGTPIELAASISSEAPERVWLEVSDRGAGLPPEQTRRLRVLDAPDVRSRGLGLELARTLASLSGGSVEWFPRPGGGTLARLELPAATTIVEAAP